MLLAKIAGASEWTRVVAGESTHVVCLVGVFQDGFNHGAVSTRGLILLMSVLERAMSYIRCRFSQ